jgi:hypothetical protein
MIHVGDSPEGPLKTVGILLKTCKKPKRNSSHLSAHTGHGPHCGGPRGPPEWPNQRLPRAGSASLEGSRLPRAGSASLEGSRLPRAGSASLQGSCLPRAGSTSLEGSRLPRAGSASLEGSRLPRAGSASLEGSRLLRAGSALLEGSSPPRSRPPHEHTCSRTRVRTFNALTQQSRAIMRLGITPRRCSANSLGGTHPRHCGDCATWPVLAPWHCSAHSRTANAPRPRRGGGHTLEPLSHESAGSNHDVRAAGRHPRHCWSCAAAPVPVAPRRAQLQQLQCYWACGDGTPPRPPLYPVRITVN